MSQPACEEKKNNAVRDKRWITIHGFRDRVNEVYVLPRHGGLSDANCVVYFPGDISDKETDMRQGECNLSRSYARTLSIERTVESLAEKFFAHTIIAIRPSQRVEQQPSLCKYANFVQCSELGNASYNAETTEATQHLLALLQGVHQNLLGAEETTLQTEPVEEALPAFRMASLEIVAYSKGVVVLNQLISELAHHISTKRLTTEEILLTQKRRKNSLKRGIDSVSPETSPTATNEVPTRQTRESALDPRVAPLWRQVSTLYFLDGGNGRLPGASPMHMPAVRVLAMFCQRISRRRPGIHIVVQGTPYQWASQERPWIIREKTMFLQYLIRYGADKAHVHEQYLYKHQQPSLDQHLRLLKEFTPLVAEDCT